MAAQACLALVGSSARAAGPREVLRFSLGLRPQNVDLSHRPICRSGLEDRATLVPVGVVFMVSGRPRNLTLRRIRSAWRRRWPPRCPGRAGVLPAVSGTSAAIGAAPVVVRSAPGASPCSWTFRVERATRARRIAECICCPSRASARTRTSRRVPAGLRPRRTPKADVARSVRCDGDAFVDVAKTLGPL